MKKQESKSFKELAAQPIKSDLSREFSEEEIQAMAKEDDTADLDFSEGKFMGIEGLAALVKPKKKRVMISIRLDEEVLDWYRGRGRGYQSFIGQLLSAYKQSQEQQGSQSQQAKAPGAGKAQARKPAHS